MVVQKQTRLFKKLTKLWPLSLTQRNAEFMIKSVKLKHMNEENHKDEVEDRIRADLMVTLFLPKIFSTISFSAQIYQEEVNKEEDPHNRTTSNVNNKDVVMMIMEIHGHRHSDNSAHSSFSYSYRWL